MSDEEKQDNTPEQPDTDTPPASGGDGPTDDTPTTPESTFTQADVDRIVKDRLERERKVAEERERKAREEAERKAAEEQGKFKELYEEAQARIEEEERRRKKLELDMLRREVADEVGLPAVLANRLQGETKDELEADAKSLLETLPQADAQAPNLNGGAGRGERPGDDVVLTDAQLDVAKKMNLTPEEYKAQLSQ